MLGGGGIVGAQIETGAPHAPYARSSPCWSLLGSPKHNGPHHSGDRGRDSNFDNLPYGTRKCKVSPES